MHPELSDAGIVWYIDNTYMIVQHLRDDNETRLIVLQKEPTRQIGEVYYSKEPVRIIYNPQKFLSPKYRKLVEDVLDIATRAPELGVVFKTTDPETGEISEYKREPIAVSG